MRGRVYDHNDCLRQYEHGIRHNEGLVERWTAQSSPLEERKHVRQEEYNSEDCQPCLFCLWKLGIGAES